MPAVRFTPAMGRTSNEALVVGMVPVGCRLGGGVQGGRDVYALYNVGGRLYAGGSFDYVYDLAGDPPSQQIDAKRIAVWDGRNWSPLTDVISGDEAGLNGTVRAITFYNADIAIGGDFSLGTKGSDPDTTLNRGGYLGWPGLA